MTAITTTTPARRTWHRLLFIDGSIAVVLRVGALLTDSKLDAHRSGLKVVAIVLAVGDLLWVLVHAAWCRMAAARHPRVEDAQRYVLYLVGALTFGLNAGWGPPVTRSKGFAVGVVVGLAALACIELQQYAIVLKAATSAIPRRRILAGFGIIALAGLLGGTLGTTADVPPDTVETRDGWPSDTPVPIHRPEAWLKPATTADGDCVDEIGDGAPSAVAAQLREEAGHYPNDIGPCALGRAFRLTGHVYLQWIAVGSALIADDADHGQPLWLPHVDALLDSDPYLDIRYLGGVPDYRWRYCGNGDCISIAEHGERISGMVLRQSFKMRAMVLRPAAFSAWWADVLASHWTWPTDVRHIERDIWEVELEDGRVLDADASTPLLTPSREEFGAHMPAPDKPRPAPTTVPVSVTTTTVPVETTTTTTVPTTVATTTTLPPPSVTLLP